ncbi:MAG: HEAT repeat domain-containing protein, partial [Elusimicrobia bacterium]|nr:HEAT repeat domain-containing protein [Elusimicrobiota bacterium]
AKLKNPDHFKFFREALLDSSVAIQFSAVEALQIWGRAEAMPLLLDAAGRSWSPLIRVYAAQSALRLGDNRGRDLLITYLRDQNWLLRALSARYLGELGQAQDADLLLSRIGPEQDNKYVLAEVCIAALKLTALRGPGPSPAVPVAPPQPPTAPGVPKRREAFELEPLVVTAPRLRLQPAHYVDVRIDNDLVRLLEKMAGEPPPEEQVLDPVLNEVNKLVTPTGFALKTRYSDLSFLLVEGLAGARDFSLVQRLESIARGNPNARVKAAALVALAYDKNRQDLMIFQEALRDPSLVVRFGAVEALSLLGAPSVRPTLAITAQSDSSPALRVFSAQALRRAGDPYGRELLLRAIDDFDWVVRAMATYYLGELGEPEDYHKIAFKLNSETNDYVVSETCLALLRLAGQ